MNDHDKTREQLLAELIALRRTRETERQATYHFLTSLEQVEQAIRDATDIEQMLRDVIHLVRTIFDSDRAWLIYPCDPTTLSFQVPVETHSPEYPGMKVANQNFPMSPDLMRFMQTILATDGPIATTNGTEKPVPEILAARFAVQSQLAVALYPKKDKPWLFGLHQCSHARSWTEDEQWVFIEIGRRIADALNTLSVMRDLRTSEEKYRLLIENQTDLIIKIGLDYKFQFVSPSFCRLIGKTEAELLGESVIPFIHKDDQAGNIKAMESFLQSPHTVYIEQRGLTRDGWRWQGWAETAIFDETGNMVSILGVGRDITDRKRADEALQAERDRAQLYLDIAGVMMVAIDEAGRVLLVNQKTCQILGYPKEEIIGRNWYEHFLPASIRDEVISMARNILTGEDKKVETFLNPVLTRNGEERLIVWTNRILQDETGRAIGFLGSGEDITEIVQANKTLEQLNIRLEEQNQELQLHQHRLEELVAERTSQLEVVASMSEKLNAILDLDQLLTELVNQIKTDFGYYHVHIFLLNTSTGQLVVAAGTGEAGRQMVAQRYTIPLDADQSPVAQAARTGQVIRENNARKLDKWLPNALLPDTRSEIVVPIISKGNVVGVLTVVDDKVAGIDDGGANLLRSLAGHIAVALTNARLFEQNQLALQKTETLYTISRRLVVANNLADLLAAVAEEIALPIINRAILGVFDYDQTDAVASMTVRANWYSGTGTEPSPIQTVYSKETLVDGPFFADKPLFFNFTTVHI